MAASAVNITSNGPSSNMYTLRPYQTIDVVQLPEVMYKMQPYCTINQDGPAPRASSSAAAAGSSTPTFTGPLAELEQRQEDVLKRLEAMQTMVSQLESKYKVQNVSGASSSGPSSSSSASVSTAIAGTGFPKFEGKPGRTLDLAISADPSRVPLSLVVLAEQLSRQFPTLLSTYTHSSVASSGVPDRLQQLLKTNGSRSRADCQVAVSLVWKKVSYGPHLVVDPVHQTSIQGEANVARYLWGLLAPSGHDLDPAQATLEDELVDLAQLQVIEGNNKERAAAIKRLNAVLGKSNAWVMGGNTPSLVDLVCWSALHQTGSAQAAPANVQRWLTNCRQHGDFAQAQEIVNSLSS